MAVVQGMEFGRMQLYSVVYASPLLLEGLDPSFEVVDPACMEACQF